MAENKGEYYNPFCDYLSVHGRTSLTDRPFSDVDAMILAQLAYINWEYTTSDYSRNTDYNEKHVEVELNCTVKEAIDSLSDDYMHSLEPEMKDLLEALQVSDRFADMKICYYEDNPVPVSLDRIQNDSTSVQQFSAVTFVYEDADGIHNHIAMRGTDPTLQGWFEDFNMSYDGCTEAQKRALEYLDKVSNLLDGPIELSGHSKGGNHANFAALFADEETQERIDRIYTFDSPGFSSNISMENEDGSIVVPSDQDIAWLRSILRSIAPSNSIIGQLLDDHGNSYVMTREAPFKSHPMLTWVIDPQTGNLVYTQQSVISKETNHLLDSLLTSMTDEEKKIFMDTLYTFILNAGIEDFHQLLDNMGDLLEPLMEYLRNNCSAEQRELFINVVISLVACLTDDYMRHKIPGYDVIADRIKELLHEMGIESLPQLINAVKEAGPNLIHGLVEAVLGIPEALAAFVEAWQNSGFHLMIENSLAFLMALGSFGVSFGKFDFAEMIASLWEMVGLMNVIADNWIQMKDEITAWLNQTGELITFIAENFWSTLVKELTETIPQLIDSIFDAMIEQYERYIKTPVSMIADGISIMVENVQQKIAEFADGFKNEADDYSNPFCEYLSVNGATSLTDRPFSDADAMILAQLAYINWEYTQAGYSRNTHQNEEHVEVDLDCTVREAIEALPQSYIDSLEPEMRDLLEDLKVSDRFANMKICYYEDNPVPVSLDRIQNDSTSIQQFSAVTFVYEDADGTHNHIAMRGTDPTFQGWFEDFNMSYDGCTEAQKRALEYLNKISNLCDGPIELSGHSKGGNHATFAALFADEETRERIDRIYTFDSPGFSSNISMENGDGSIVVPSDQDIAWLRSILHSIAPSNSIIGQLMDDHGNAYVMTREAPIASHSMFTWVIDPKTGNLVYTEQSVISKETNHLLDSLLASMTDDEKKMLMDTLYTFILNAGIEDFDQLLANMGDLLGPLMAYFRDNCSAEQRELFINVVISLIICIIDDYMRHKIPGYDVIADRIKEILHEMGIESLPQFINAVKEAGADFIYGLMEAILGIPEALEAFVEAWQNSGLHLLIENSLAFLMALCSFGVSLGEFDLVEMIASLWQMVALMNAIADNWIQMKDEIATWINQTGELVASLAEQLWGALVKELTETVPRLVESIFTAMIQKYIETPGSKIAGGIAIVVQKVQQMIADGINQEFLKTSFMMNIACAIADFFFSTISIDFARLQQAVETMESLAKKVQYLDGELSRLCYFLQTDAAIEQAEEESDINVFSSIFNYYNLRAADIAVDQGENITKKANAIRKIFSAYREQEDWFGRMAELL